MVVPLDLQRALSLNIAAHDHFEGFSPSSKKVILELDGNGEGRQDSSVANCRDGQNGGAGRKGKSLPAGLN